MFTFRGLEHSATANTILRRKVPSPSLQSPTQRLSGLPSLLVADVGVAHGCADILVAEQLLVFPQILSHLVEEDRGRGVAQSMRRDLPHPKRSAPRSHRKLNARLENGAPDIPQHKLRNREGDPAGSQDPPPFKALLDRLPLLERLAKGACNRHILEDVPLAFDSQRQQLPPHPLAIAPCKLDQFLEPASGLEKGVRQVESEGRAISLLADFEIVKKSADFGEKKVADLGLVVERGLDFRKRVFQVPVVLGVLGRSPRAPKNTLTEGLQPLESLEPIEVGLE